MHLEELLYLQYNKHLWDEKSIQLILSNYNPEDDTPFVDDDSEFLRYLHFFVVKGMAISWKLMMIVEKESESNINVMEKCASISSPLMVLQA